MRKDPELPELTPEQQQLLGGCLISAGSAAMLVFILTILLCFSSCRTQYVPVPEVHTEYHHTTDSVFHTDSVIDYQTTIIREVDSATMAQYGIRLAQAEKAWLVQSDKLYKEIERLRESKHDSVFIHDSIPVPYPVPEPYPVPAELTAWQKFLMNLGGIAFWLLIIGAGIGLFKTRAKWLPWLLKLLHKL